MVGSSNDMEMEKQPKLVVIPEHPGLTQWPGAKKFETLNEGKKLHSGADVLPGNRAHHMTPGRKEAQKCSVIAWVAIQERG